jgi:hypothetical protein
MCDVRDVGRGTWSSEPGPVSGGRFPDDHPAEEQGLCIIRSRAPDGLVPSGCPSSDAFADAEITAVRIFWIHPEGHFDRE